MKVLIVEDWWADRLRFQYLLEHITEISFDFAWSAGRPPEGGRVWSIDRIVSVAEQYDRVIIDLALNKDDEDRFREAHRWTEDEFINREKSLAKEITGLRLLSSLSKKELQRDVTNRCIVASAHVYDRLRDYCIQTWGIIDTFHKWSDEEQIIRTLYESKFRSN
jgi:hypothetical protein